MSKVAQVKKGVETEILPGEDFSIENKPGLPRPKINVPNTFRELPTNDLIWWGMSIMSTFVVVETFVVGTFTKMITQSLVGAFQIWVQSGGHF